MTTNTPTVETVRELTAFQKKGLIERSKAVNDALENLQRAHKELEDAKRFITGGDDPQLDVDMQRGVVVRKVEQPQPEPEPND